MDCETIVMLTLNMFCNNNYYVISSRVCNSAALAVTKIAEELSTVDWKQLAGWLDVPHGKVEGIQAKCLRGDGDLLACYNANLVRVYCDFNGGPIQSIVEDIAQALEKMDKNLQASKLRKLELGMLHIQRRQ